MTAADKIDREELRRKLDTCINLMDPEQHPDGIINVVIGMIVPSSVNIDQAIGIGTRQMEELERKLPKVFYGTIQIKVETMAVMKKSIKVGDSKVYNTNLIYSRVIGLQTSSRDVNIEEVMSCELSPVPTALFNDTGERRISKSNTVLKNRTKVKVSSRHVTQVVPCTVIDGCALIWIPRWPASSPTKQPIVMDFVNKFKDQIKQRLKYGDVYLVFDRYEEFSIKCSTRTSRGTGGSRVFQHHPCPLRNRLSLLPRTRSNCLTLYAQTFKQIQTSTRRTHKHINL